MWSAPQRSPHVSSRGSWQIIAGVHKSWEGVIKRYDGFVARYMGDGVLAYFGYPNGHEDDAERAAHAALEIVDLATSPGCSVAVRVGIATGLTVVGGSIGEAGSQEMPAFGLTPNIAAHLQAVAPRNAVVIAEGTRRLIGSKFECAEIGPCELKGVAERVSAWRLIQARATESRFTAHHDGAEFPTVGRGTPCPGLATLERLPGIAGLKPTSLEPGDPCRSDHHPGVVWF
jgi:class 3 adenylate cyclase